MKQLQQIQQPQQTINIRRYQKISMDSQAKTVKTSHQINLKMPEGFYKIAKSFAKEHEYRSVQELILESLRIRILPRPGNFDEDITPKEQRIIDAALKRVATGEEKLEPADDIFKVLEK